ncbi:MAG: hypothetical protein DM484_01260 [Candidatus Methylumidiphilus alinenensis]|jgi:hypothetical protein|uniref:Uncharacterized protein n=1 Tax=Candidatus Methylumidiphilus alinenensis TaxID=2202197 RepID=A0A2W4RSD7_9GAMM|nr:MAG: hypothetical protein DM484_01260 [Candidatus Methylumidiphilus alinenensis]
MARQYFSDGPFVDPPVASGTALVSTSSEALWLATQFTPIFANDPKAGKIYVVEAGGIMTTSTSGTLIIAPQYGALGGTTLGVSVTQTVVVSLTNVPWYLRFVLVFRTIGATGANSTCIGTGTFNASGAAATAGSSIVIPFGGTSATVDATANSGITIAKTLSVAGSMTTQYAFIRSLN